MQVGKYVGHEQHMHMSFVCESPHYDLIAAALNAYPGDLVMINPHCYTPGAGLTVTIRYSDDFDTAHEPSVSKTVRVKAFAIGDVQVLHTSNYRNNTPIIRGKHLLVHPEYTGFDKVEAALRYQWSEELIARHGGGRSLRAKVGYKKFWEEFIKEEVWQGLKLSR